MTGEGWETGGRSDRGGRREGEEGVTGESDRGGGVTAEGGVTGEEGVIREGDRGE